MTAVPNVSVVIPCYNAASTLRRQVEALLPQLHGKDELICVDNRSSDSTADLIHQLEQQDCRVRYVSAFEKPGVNHARNAGVRAAYNDFILLCDADDRVHAGWVTALRMALTTDGLAGGTAQVVDEEGRSLGPDLALHSIFGGPDYPLGACMAARREVFEAVGSFDESFVGGHDEADFAWRAHSAGWTTVHVPAAVIDYVQRPNVKGLARQRRSYARTAIQLWARHPDSVSLHGVSFKAAAVGALRSLPQLLCTVTGRATSEQASKVGWAWGLLEGHLRYRVFGSPPAAQITPILPAPTERHDQ